MVLKLQPLWLHTVVLAAAWEQQAVMIINISMKEAAAAEAYRPDAFPLHEARIIITS
jgi:hypothetical protein